MDVFNSKELLNADIEMLNDFEKEHVIPYFFNRRNKFRISFLKSSINFDLDEGFSVDTKDDFECARKIISIINWDDFTYKDILKAKRSLNG